VCKTVVVIAGPEHTVGLEVPLVNTPVEARLRVTVPDAAGRQNTVQYVLKLLLWHGYPEAVEYHQWLPVLAAVSAEVNPVGKSLL
jgi:hypothetical protein